MTTETTEYASKGVAGTGLGLGIAGTALGLLNGGLGLMGNNGVISKQETPKYVNKDEFIMGQELARKDSEIALLKSESNTEKKMAEVYANIETQINRVKDKIDQNRDRADDRLTAAYEKLNSKIDSNKAFQDGVNAQQLVYNGTNSATLACMQNQIAELKTVTKLVIPNSNLCPGVPPVYLTHTSPALSA